MTNILKFKSKIIPWNRLVEVAIDPDPGSEPPADLQIRVRYGYNGLHWRVWCIADEDLDVGALPDTDNLYYYDAMWRLLEEHRRGNFDSSEDEWTEVLPDSGDLLKITQRFWCLHYIDDLIAWQTQHGYDDDGWVDPDGAFEDSDALFYALTDRLYSVIGVLDGVGAGYPLVERVRYSAYGSARHIPVSLGDVNGDGFVTFEDYSIVLARYGEVYEDDEGDYTPDADFRQDGAIGFDDFTLVLGYAGQGVPEGALSLQTVGNTIGYAGYHFDPATGMSLARHRWLEHDLGRWVTRDPAGYSDSFNLYQYVEANPNSGVDALGLRTCHRITVRKEVELPDWFKRIQIGDFKLEQARVRFTADVNFCEPDECCAGTGNVKIGYSIEVAGSKGKLNLYIAKLEIGLYGAIRGSGHVVGGLRGCARSEAFGGGCATIGGEAGLQATIIGTKWFIKDIGAGIRGGVAVHANFCLDCNAGGNAETCQFRIEVCGDIRARAWVKVRTRDVFYEYHKGGCATIYNGQILP